jgi:multimeric flavodoxin WrbA
MKVLGLFGSPRKGGNTELLLEEALRGAEEEGAEVERVYLARFAVSPCRACHGCDRSGQCVIQDDMQALYPKILGAEIIFLASPIYFYSITAWSKMVIDRIQALWTRKYLALDPSLGKEAKKRKGFFISVGATRGQKLFEGAILTVRYFFDAFNADYAGDLLFREVDGKGDILKIPDALPRAREAGRRLVAEAKAAPAAPGPG